MRVTTSRLLQSVVLAGSVAMSATAAVAQVSDVPLPATKAGQLAGDWIRFCRSPDHDQITQWLSANLSADAADRRSAANRASEQLVWCLPNGGFRVREVTKSDPDSITVLMVGVKSQTWFTMTLGVNNAGKLDRTEVSPTTPVESAMPRDLSDATLASDVRQLVARQSEAGLFTGIVVVARDTQIIVTASAGYADRTKRTPITGSTQFTLGSMGKMFTAAAIGQLVERGRMTFDDTIGKFFPEYPNATARDHVTVGMILSHTAGMGNFLGKRTPDMMIKGVKRAAEFMPLYDSAALQFTPGTSWAYSNAGVALAGAIVEQVSGEDYPAYIRQHIFAVAGMTSSDPNNVPLVSGQMATPYTHFTDEGVGTEWNEAPHDIGSPAGGAVSTTHDLVRFAAALRDGRLVRKATFAEMTKPRHVVPSGDQYGYAMEIKDVYGRTVVGHGGGFAGVSTHLYLVLDSPYTVVILSNQDPPADAFVGSTVVAWVAEKAKRGT